MIAVTARAQHRDAPPPRVRWRALLVLGLLAGLLGMHALAPGGTVMGHAAHAAHAVRAVHPVHAANAAPRHMTVSVGVRDGCAGDDCGGHVHHADQTCASGALGGGPVLLAPVADPVTVHGPAEISRRHAGAAPDGARAPPSLAELQLLRI